MFILKRKNQEAGIVLVTVVIVTLIMMILIIGIISSNVSQSLSSRYEIKRIKAEQFAKGAVWYNYSSRLFNGVDATAPPVTLDGENYVATVTPGNQVNGIIPYNIVVTFNAD